MPLSACLDCGTILWMRRTRCKPCQRAQDERHNRQVQRVAYADPMYRAMPLGGVCWVCGKPGSDTRDHVIALVDGGTNDPGNLRPAHRVCNSGR